MKKRLLCMILTLTMIFCLVPSAAAAASDEAAEAAEALYELGLFKGTGTNPDGTPIFDLDKTPTRNQAIIMLVRLLGKEDEAKAGTWDIPFTDVSDAMRPYIGYAYANGLTNGTTATTYSGGNPIKANQYITFVLRALGYTSGEDFSVSTAWDFSDEIGLTDGRYDASTDTFLRADVALISEKALYTNIKAENRMLCVEILASKGAGIKNANYDPVLNNWPGIIKMAHPRLSIAEVQKMVSLNLSLDEVADIITTPADLVQYLHQRGYTTDSGDIHFDYGGYQWSVNRSARTVFENNKGNCGGGSNLANYILHGDFDAQGYVGETGNQGGHVYNFFKQDGMYYFFDLTEIVRMGRYDKSGQFPIYATADPQKFSDYYIGINHAQEGRDGQNYLLFQFMYEYEGDHLPKGQSDERTVLDKPYSNVLPKQYKDVTTILFVEEGMSGPIYVDAPEQSQWPKEAQ